MIQVDQSSMTGKIVSCDLWHSFAQYIKSKDNYMYVLEQVKAHAAPSFPDTTEIPLRRLPLNYFHMAVPVLQCGLLTVMQV